MAEHSPSRPIGHYSNAIGVDIGAGRLVYLSGQVPTDATGATIGRTMTEQAEHVFLNIRRSLESQGADLTHLVKVTVFLTDMAEFDEFNAVRNRHFSQHRPASTLVEVSSLAIADHKVEIEATAYVPR
jgi:reactive intermediate/imine deaminase